MTRSLGDDTDPRQLRVVECAARLLAEEGPHALSLRRIAADAGGSTQLVYTLFGGKAGLADALYAEGFRRLGVAMNAALEAEQAPVGSPDRLLALGRGYRRFAVEEPAFFAVMFGRAIPGFTPARATRTLGREHTLGQVVAVAQECLDAQTVRGADATEVARACWTTVHGVAALEHAGLLAGDVDAFADHVGRLVVDAHRPA